MRDHSNVMTLFTPKDIQYLEQELDIQLPETYKTFLLEQSSKPVFREVAGEFGDTIEWLIESNFYCRTHSFFGQLWPQNFIVIHSDGSGNLYFLDVARPVSPVFLADHELTASQSRLVVEEQALTFAAWIAQRQQEAADCRAEEHAYWARRQQKKWWQFWR